jgi:hypothetical protein
VVGGRLIGSTGHEEELLLQHPLTGAEDSQAGLAAAHPAFSLRRFVPA